jgi:hypothetical protein
VLRRLLAAMRAPRHPEQQTAPTQPAQAAVEPVEPDPVLVLRAARDAAPAWEAPLPAGPLAAARTAALRAGRFTETEPASRGGQQ